MNDQSAKVYLTPDVNSSGRFSGDLTATGATIDASGGWWDAGDYLIPWNTYDTTSHGTGLSVMAAECCW